MISSLKKLIEQALLGLGFATLTACQSSTEGAQDPIPARTLARQYQESSIVVRHKYNGKEITVQGYASTLARTQLGELGQGAIAIAADTGKLDQQITCWFSLQHLAEFSNLREGEVVTVTGIFNGEAGAELKFCKLVKSE